VYLARIYVTLKPTVNDPQGLTVLGSLKQMGFPSVGDVRMGKYLEIRVDETDRHRAQELVDDMCHKLLANPVIEEYRFDLHEITATHGSQSN
jgi:phosphoribosylformylglycinamidine synthase PurS subunit